MKIRWSFSEKEEHAHPAMRRVFPLLLGLSFVTSAIPTMACCAVGGRGEPVVNADQTVILLWDKERRTEHFIRRATFRGEGKSVGFLVPTPSRPQLEESGDAAFPYLAEVTAPSASKGLGMPLGCSAMPPVEGYARSVRVIEEKTVAGYEVVVLAADSGKALVEWLRAHDYTYTEEAAAWAQPYLEGKWYMTAMRIAKRQPGQAVSASALRISFQTDQPLFPYREPDSRKDAAKLGAADRTLRIYFVGEARYEGQFPAGQAWGGRARWSQSLATTQKAKLLEHLKLPASTGPATFWLTEIEDRWPYGKAPGDVYFSRSEKQQTLAGGTVVLDPTLLLALGVCVVRPICRRFRRREQRSVAKKTEC